MTIRIWAIVVGAIVAVSGSGTAVASEAESSETGTPPGGFSDVGSVHRYGIEQVAKLGIDAGCGEGRFCPDDPISRAEMAAWLYRAAAHINGAHIPPPQGETAPMLSEDDAAVSRAEAAVMLTAAFGHLAAVDEIAGVFADTGDTPEATARAIEGIHAAGLTKGCATEPLRYCPHQPITRGQAAAMLARAIGRAEPTVGLIVNEPQAARGYTLFNANHSDSVYLIDHLGRKVHTWRIEGREVNDRSELLENGNLMVLLERHGVAEIDRASNIVWEYPYSDLHHDFLKLPNGNVILLIRKLLTSSEAIAVGARLRPTLSRQWWYDYLVEVKPTGASSGEVVWQWSIMDHLVQDNDPDKPNYGPIAEHPERIDINYTLHQPPLRRHFTHINALDYNPALDQIMISARNYSELWIIDHNTTTEEAAGPKGDLLYRWGNPRAHGNGDYQDQQLFLQHNTHWIPQGLPGAGNVLIFNNGFEYKGLERNYSTIDEILLPPFEDNAYELEPGYNFTAPQQQWSYSASNPADFYSSLFSGAQRLPNGNTQICNGNRGIVFQVTPDGTTVWKYINPVPKMGPPVHQGDHARNTIYRARWYPPDYPGLQYLHLTPKNPIEQYR